ncbi:hypothetical protein [Martelella mangrovi]|uniref:Unsaturated chondroitin disaccharide hydrolase n=1 Tax=Martelella mangrovi TaxID=1397477 RepID=A0ABV2IDH0_9HYPH
MTISTAPLADATQMTSPLAADRQAVLDRCVARVSETSRVIGLRNPRVGRADLSWDYCDPFDWVISFYAGQLWLAYQFSGNPALANLARARQADLRLVLDTVAGQDHDLGFIFSLNCVADWKLTGHEASRALALRAADALRARFNCAGNYIQAWNAAGPERPERAAFVAGRIIADTMQNLALLYWAHAETGNPDFKAVADSHAETTRKTLVRDDGTSFHTYVFDPVTGVPLRGETHQGYAHDSCWSRGQAWLIHGFSLCYQTTGNADYLATARRLASAAEVLLGDDAVPLWDFRLPAGEPQHLDSSAGAVMSAGLFILADVTTGEESLHWRALAERLLDGLVKNCDLTQTQGALGLLSGGAANVPRGSYDTMLPYGDYYYMEALMRSLGHRRFGW